MAKTPSRPRKTAPEPAPEFPGPDDIIEDAEILSEDPAPEVLIESEPEAETVEPEPAPAPIDPGPPRRERQPAFLPLVLGGAVAAGLGFGAAYLYLPKDDGSTAATLAQQADALAAQSVQLDTLLAKVAALESAPGPEPALTALQKELQDQLDALSQDQDAALAGLAARIDAVERAPNADGSLPQSAIDAFQGDIAALRAEVAAQATEMTALADAAATQLEQTRASAAAIEQSAEQSSNNAIIRVALARIQAALESGAPFDLDLPDLQTAIGAPLPPALSAVAAEGVPTLAVLLDTYPDAARNALATARREGVSGEDDSTTAGFLRNMFDVRSVTPRDGMTTDAILSRAEAALGEGRLADTLAEIATLPEVASNDFTEWSAQAQSRLDALAAVEALSLSLSQN